ncbi:hypothetical protein MCETHM1_01659 [Flavobacteriaceae bacterium]
MSNFFVYINENGALAYMPVTVNEGSCEAQKDINEQFLVTAVFIDGVKRSILLPDNPIQMAIVNDNNFDGRFVKLTDYNQSGLFTFGLVPLAGHSSSVGGSLVSSKTYPMFEHPVFRENVVNVGGVYNPAILKTTIRLYEFFYQLEYSSHHDHFGTDLEVVDYGMLDQTLYNYAQCIRVQNNYFKFKFPSYSVENGAFLFLDIYTNNYTREVYLILYNSDRSQSFALPYEYVDNSKDKGFDAVYYPTGLELTCKSVYH